MKIRANLLITFLATNGATALQLVVTLILSRLLTPAEIGVFSITLIFVAIAEVFRDFGVGGYIQREKDLDSEKIASAFGLLVFSSWFIALCMYLGAPFAAKFFNQSGVESVLKVLSLGFLIIPAGTLTHNLLSRELKAKQQAYVKAFGVLVYAVIAIELARLGLGYLSLAWAQVASIGATSLAYIPLRPNGMPWRPSTKYWGSIARFGGGAILGNVINSANNSLSDFFLGRFSTPHQVGIMSKSLSTPHMLIQLIDHTAQYAIVPVLSKKFHANENIHQPVLMAVAYYTAILWPALIAVSVFSSPIVGFLYGPSWAETAPIITVLCLLSALWVPFAFNSGLLMATGRPYMVLWPTGVALVFKLLFAMLWFDGGLWSYVYALVVASFVEFCVNGWVLLRVIGVDFFLFWRKIKVSLLISIVLFPLLLAVEYASRDFGGFVRIFILCLFYGLTWPALVFVLNHPLRVELERVSFLINQFFNGK